MTISRIEQIIKNVLNFWGEYFLSYNYCFKFGSFRVISLNVKFPLTSLLKMATIFKVWLTSIYSNRAQNAPQNVPFYMNHGTFGLQGKECVFFHPYAELDNV